MEKAKRSKKTKKGSGGKLNRSMIVQARLDPRVHFVGELLARLERRTLSSLIEHLIDESGKKELIGYIPSGETETKTITVDRAVSYIWDKDEVMRLIGLALHMPYLLTYEEDNLWEFIKLSPYFWVHHEVELRTSEGQLVEKQWLPIISLQTAIREHLVPFWENSLATGNFDFNSVPKEIGKKANDPQKLPALKKVLKSYPLHGSDETYQYFYYEIANDGG